MTTTFQRTFLNNDWSFVRGPARLLWASEDKTFPAELDDVIKIPGESGVSGSDDYDAQSGWNDLGATKGGISISVNPSGSKIAIDPNTGNINSDPDTWEVGISTSLAESRLESFQVAWEASDILDFSNSHSVFETRMNVGPTNRFTARRLAILYLNEDTSFSTSLVRGIIFRRVQLKPEQSQISFAKTGDQQTIPLAFDAFADTSVAPINGKFFSIFQQQ